MSIPLLQMWICELCVDRILLLLWFIVTYWSSLNQSIWTRGRGYQNDILYGCTFSTKHWSIDLGVWWDGTSQKFLLTVETYPTYFIMAPCVWENKEDRRSVYYRFTALLQIAQVARLKHCDNFPWGHGHKACIIMTCFIKDIRYGVRVSGTCIRSWSVIAWKFHSSCAGLFEGRCQKSVIPIPWFCMLDGVCCW